MSSDHFSSGSIRIKGNGNAVGNGNHVTNIQKQTNHFHKSSGGGGGGAPRNQGGDPGMAIGIFAGAAIALAALSFWFAKYAPQIYTALTIAFYCSALLGVLAVILDVRLGAYNEALRNSMVVLAAIAGAFAVSLGSSSMHREIVELAQHGTFNSFWCRLSLDGQRIASQHSVLGTFALVPLAFTTIMQSLRGSVYALWAENGVSAGVESIFESLAGPKPFAAMLFVCTLSVVGHLDTGTLFWNEHFNSRIAFMCGRG